MARLAYREVAAQRFPGHVDPYETPLVNQSEFNCARISVAIRMQVPMSRMLQLVFSLMKTNIAAIRQAWL